jgi:arylsulfatase A-like enzyme
MSSNILLITSDEHRFDALGCNSSPYVNTPHLDKLAREGLNFQNHTCSAPVCTPARASILTGQYSRTHGAWHVGYMLNQNKPGLAHWLSKEGYRCGFFGKAHFEPELSQFAENMDHSKPYYGFQDFAITEDNPAGEYIEWVKSNFPEYRDSVYRTVHEEMQRPPIPLRESGTFKAVYTSPIPEEVHQTAWIADRTLDFIREQATKQKPFFAWCSFVDPHHPWIPPEPFASMYKAEEMPAPCIAQGENEGLVPGYQYPEDMPVEEYQRMCAAYYAMISHIDHHIGRILDFLRETGLYDNTIIIYTSDHGDYNGDHGLIRKNPWLFDNVLRVPMIVRYPEAEHFGIRIEYATQHEDIAPTLLELANISVPDTVQGISFAPILKAGELGLREYSYYDHMGKVGVQKGHYKLLYYPKASWPRGKPENNTTEDGHFRLIDYPDRTDGFILTNTLDDPLEYVNLYGVPSCSDIERELKEQLFQWMLRTPIYYPSKQYNW